MHAFRSISLGLSALLLASPGMALADCQKTGSLICGSGAPRIASDAPLEVSRGSDFAALEPGAALKGGDRILVGTADATLTLGSACQAAVGAGSLVSIRGAGGKICASVTEQAAQMNGSAADDDDHKKKIDPLLVGIAATAGAAALAVGVALSNNGGGSGGTVSAK